MQALIEALSASNMLYGKRLGAMPNRDPNSNNVMALRAIIPNMS
jgi:hypothetical protein